MFAAGGSHRPALEHATFDPLYGGHVMSPGVHDCVHTVTPISANGWQLPFVQSCSVLHGSYVCNVHLTPPSLAGVLPLHAVIATTTTKLRSMHSS
jgi:hypothetical protein